MAINFNIGIQYNWRDGETYALKAKLQPATSDRIAPEEEHVTITFTDNQPPGGQNRKLLDRILPEGLPISDYSNIYFRLPTPSAGVPLLKATGRINVPTITDKTDFLTNFTNADADLLAAIRTDARYAYYNELFQMMARVAAATGMLHTLEFEFEGKEEWGTEEDMVFVSCMLEDEEII